MYNPEPLLTGAGGLGHTLSLQSLVQKGAVLLGRTEDASASEIFFDNNIMDHITLRMSIRRKSKGTSMSSSRGARSGRRTVTIDEEDAPLYE
jgi:hypothetical protein